MHPFEGDDKSVKPVNTSSKRTCEQYSVVLVRGGALVHQTIQPQIRYLYKSAWGESLVVVASARLLRTNVFYAYHSSVFSNFESTLCVSRTWVWYITASIRRQCLQSVARLLAHRVSFVMLSCVASKYGSNLIISVPYVHFIRCINLVAFITATNDNEERIRKVGIK